MRANLVFFLGLLFSQGGMAAVPSSDLPTLRFPLSIVFPSLDPTEAEDFINIRLLENLGQGLMTYTPELKPILGLAESFKVSQNGKTYTFKLKKSHWSDSKPITAMDFERGFKRTLSPETRAKISQNFQDLVVGARDYKSKKNPDFKAVGIKVIDEGTLEIKLVKPAPYFLSLLSLPFAFPQRESEGFIIKAGTPTSGPYKITSLNASSKVLLEPNEFFEPRAKNKVEIKIIGESSSAVALYEKNEIDILERIPSSDFERFKNSPELVSAPFLATYYLGFNIIKKPFDHLSVRKAIASAIHRQDISKILKDPQIISSSWVPTPLDTSDEDFSVKISEEDKSLAKNELASEKPLLVFDSQEKNTLVASFVQQQLKKNLDLELDLKSMEWKSYLNFLNQEKPAFYRFAWLTAFPDPLSHLDVFTSQNPNNYSGFANKNYDKLVTQIAQLTPGKKRHKLIQEAQRILLQDFAVIIPLFHYRQYSLIKKNWEGLDLTPMGLLYFNKANLKRGP